MQDLPSIWQEIAVAIGQLGIRTNGIFLSIRQAIAVAIRTQRIALRHAYFKIVRQSVPVSVRRYRIGGIAKTVLPCRLRQDRTELRKVKCQVIVAVSRHDVLVLDTNDSVFSIHPEI